jgi:hypothetical protein
VLACADAPMLNQQRTNLRTETHRTGRGGGGGGCAPGRPCPCVGKTKKNRDQADIPPVLRRSSRPPRADRLLSGYQARGDAYINSSGWSLVTRSTSSLRHKIRCLFVCLFVCRLFVWAKNNSNEEERINPFFTGGKSMSHVPRPLHAQARFGGPASSRCPRVQCKGALV